MPRFFRLTLPLLVLAGLSLGACGRRGPLEPPPGSAPPSPRSEARIETDPASQSNATRPSLARNTNPQDSLDREKVLAPAVPVTVPKTPFFLDPLL